MKLSICNVGDRYINSHTIRSVHLIADTLVWWYIKDVLLPERSILENSSFKQNSIFPLSAFGKSYAAKGMEWERESLVFAYFPSLLHSACFALEVSKFAQRALKVY